MQQTRYPEVPFEGAGWNALTAVQGGNPIPHDRASSQNAVRLVPRLVSSAISINYEKNKGRVQYFSPTTSLGRYCKEILCPQPVVPEEWRQLKRPYKVLAEISREAENDLMEIFWTRYNATKNVVDPEAYCSDKESGRSTSYSGFFHMCALAMGFLFANQEKQELRHISLDGRSSIFYQDAKYALDAELEDPEGLATIRAMMVLSDLECAYGREELGWIYTGKSRSLSYTLISTDIHLTDNPLGVSCRLALDFGLNLDCSELRLSEVEMQIRIDLLRSCILHDMSWSIYLGRSTCIKSSDFAISCSRDILASLRGTARFPSRFAHGKPASQDVVIESQIHVALLSLTEITVKIQATAHMRCYSEDQYLEVATMDSMLDSWHSTLPTQLHWSPENAKNAPPIFFVLHQQYHTTQILLHGPCAQYEEKRSVEPESSNIGNTLRMGAQDAYSFFQLSRTISFNSALRVAEIFSSYRQRFGRCESSLFSVQHAGTAALLLIASIPQLEHSKQILALQHLQILRGFLQEMSMIHRPVKTMFTVVDHITQRYVEDLKISQPPKVPTTSCPNPSKTATITFASTPSATTIRYPINLTHPSSPSNLMSHSRKKRRFTSGLDELSTTPTTPPYQQFSNLRKVHSHEDSRANLTYDVGGGGLESHTSPSLSGISADFPLGTFFTDMDCDDFNNTHNIADMSGQGAQNEYVDTFVDSVFE